MSGTFIGIPAGDGHVTGGLAFFLSNLPDGYKVGVYNQIRGLAYARNVIAEFFLDSDCDRLWFLDADVIPPSDVMRLTDVDADIVGGTYHQMMASPNRAQKSLRLIAGDENGKPLALPDDGVVDAGFVAFGCTLIRREVLEDPRMILDDTCRPRAFFQEIREANGRVTVTDDAEYCHRARSNGYTVKCHAGIRCGHDKWVDLSLVAGLAA